ncbi:helix-turn-helix transcriptional regulator [Roseibacillus ishigakijimensis]|uniref:Helix-turn-helix transcriptional regulator n=1 Tax=Roseibacillus ishigakijimensis TaxID=454146 RepID=A0A934RL33_9BACT|nr:helix-turn-helix transcriptional regulator [Roseibacillus ishigakijimensis]MBK1832823.1 helix-turn-helix transcriptional regulator [Roseibacillus ishigakijimensis]
MPGSVAIAKKIALRLQQENCVDEDYQLRKCAQVSEIIESYPLWVLVYRCDPLSALYISEKMAAAMAVPGGFIAQENEYHTVYHCDMSTAHFRFRAFEHFFRGATEPMEHTASLNLPDDSWITVSDLAHALITDRDGRATTYAHFYAPTAQPTLAQAYAFCDPDFLTPRQKEVFTLLLKGLPMATIAEQLQISIKTLEKHLTAIYDLTGQPNQLALIKKCTSPLL